MTTLSHFSPQFFFVGSQSSFRLCHQVVKFHQEKKNLVNLIMKARWGFLFSICEDLAKFGYQLEINILWGEIWQHGKEKKEGAKGTKVFLVGEMGPSPHNMMKKM